MNDGILAFFPALSALGAIAIMGLAGIRLLKRLPDLLYGRENPLPSAQGPLPVKGMLWAAALMLLCRLALVVLAWGMHRAAGSGEGLPESFRGYWEHWDVRHYVGIAERGYVAEGDERLRLVFFPLLPLLMRLFAPLFGGDVFFSGTALSFAAACLSAALLYAVAFFWRDARTARFCAACYALNPMSLFLGCVYTEALFLCLSLLCVLLMMRGHPWFAALSGMLAAFTRMPGALLSGFFLIGGLSGIVKEEGRTRRCARSLVRMGIVFSGLFLYWAVNRAVTGSAFTYLIYQRENWYQQAGSFWASTANTAKYLISSYGEDDWFWTWGFQYLSMFFGYLLLAFGQEDLPFSFAAFSFVYVAVVFSPTWLLSGARYLYGLFSLPLLVASVMKRRDVRGAWLVFSGILLVFFVYGYTIEIAVL